MTDKEQHDMFNEVFTRLRETEQVLSTHCVKLDNVISQMKSSNQVTDKFIDMLERRRMTDETRETKFWKAIAVLGGAVIVLALGKDPAKMLAEHFFGRSDSVVTQVAIPLHNDRRGVLVEAC